MAEQQTRVAIAKLIINRYEDSTKMKELSSDGSQSVKLIGNKAYDSDTNFELRPAMNKAALAMQAEGLIKIKWYEKNNIIARIVYTVSDIDRFYDIAGMKKKTDYLDNIVEYLTGFLDVIKIDWIKSFLSDTINIISSDKRIPAIIKDTDKRSWLMLSLCGISELLSSNTFMMERAFSKKYLKNSKLFENEVRVVLISIIKKYKTDIEEDLSVDGYLSEVGIEKSNTELFVKGPIILDYQGKILDLTNFPFGVALNRQLLSKSHIASANSSRLISIENKTNFLNACSNANNSDIIVFSSGFYNPSQRKFLSDLGQVMKSYAQDCLFYHSGDLDFGGLNIFVHIKKNVFNTLKPLDMNAETFIKYKEYSEPFTNEYGTKLYNLVGNDDYSQFYDLIILMLENRRILEQECLLF